MNMTKIKTIFYGTHDFAVTILKQLVYNKDIDVVQVITQPDRPVGRKKTLTPSPVKVFALEEGIEVVQPESLKHFKLGREVDLGVVAQYGKLIPEELLTVPKYETLNVHTSLLPKYRGASPIQSALIAGETETGITIMKMDAGLDTGPIIMQRSIAIEPHETYLDLNTRLGAIGAQALLIAIPLYINGTLELQEQDESQATLCTLLTRDDGRVDWSDSAKSIYDLYRGTLPWPGVWTTLDGLRLKLLNISLTGTDTLAAGHLKLKGSSLLVGTSTFDLRLEEVQIEGGKPVSGVVFAENRGKMGCCV